MDRPVPIVKNGPGHRGIIIFSRDLVLVQELDPECASGRVARLLARGNLPGIEVVAVMHYAHCLFRLVDHDLQRLALFASGSGDGIRQSSQYEEDEYSNLPDVHVYLPRYIRSTFKRGRMVYEYILFFNAQRRDRQ